MKNINSSKILRFFRWFCHPNYLDELEGDLLERYALRSAKHGQSFAKRKLNRDIIQLIRPSLIRPLIKRQKLNVFGMFKHNFLISFRSFKRYKSTFLINLFGLATGLATALLIFLWVYDEMSIDNFNEVDSDRHVQVIYSYPTSGTYHTNTNGFSPNPLCEALAKQMPEVEYAVPINYHPSYRGVLSFGDNNVHAQYQFIGKNYFNLFPGEFIHGNKNEILHDQSEIAISEKMAMSLFQSTEKAIGQLVELKDEGFGGSYIVAGVFEQASNSSTPIDILFSFELFRSADLMQWYNGGTQAHLVLNKGVDLAEFNTKIRDFLKNVWENSNFILYAQPHSQRYLHGKFEEGIPVSGRIIYVRLFSIIALFILAIACINYMNFSTANASRRIKEIGVKKAIGAHKKNLTFQYFSESIIMAYLSLLFAIVFAYLLLPQFNKITGKTLELSLNTDIVFAALAITTFTGIISGIYPALLLSNFNPVMALKGKITKHKNSIWFRKGLVVFQFSVSVILIISVLVIYKQVEFIQTTNLGYNKDHIITFPEEGKLKKDNDAFLTELRGITGVIQASEMTGNLPGRIDFSQGYKWEGMTDEDKSLRFYQIRGDYALLDLLGIELTSGRSFSKEFATDIDAVIMNETAIEMMKLENPIGQKLGNFNPRARTKEIIGVAKDFHYQSLQEKVHPFFFSISNRTTKFVVKLEANQQRETIAKLEKVYENFNEGYPFEFKFMDDDYQQVYAAEERITSLSKYFAGIAIFISCLGLLALTSFSTQRRFKEIAIRKVLGSSGFEIVKLLSKEYIILVGLGIMIAFPIGYYLMKGWLNGFAYRIGLEPFYFVVASVAMLVIAWLTIISQTLKSSKVKVTESLKSE